MKRSIPYIVGLLAPIPAFAVSITQYGWACTGFLNCGTSDIVTKLIANLITIVGTIIVATAVVAFLYGAIRMVISQGEEGKEAGKKALIYASLGLVFALLTGAILNFVCSIAYTIGGGGAGICTQLWGN